jgi:imidazolonepropionase-like amidohydrolase
MDSILPLADALDGVMMDDDAFTQCVEMGVLYSCIVPGSGNLIGGMSAVVRNYAATSTQALIARAGLKGAVGHNPKNWGASRKGTRFSTRMGGMAVLREKLDEVRTKISKRRNARGEKKKEIVFSAAEQVIADVLAGKLVLRMHAHKADDVAALLRLVDEFKLKISIEHLMDASEPEVFEELARRKIPVIYGPVDVLSGKTETKHHDWRSLRRLIEAGVELGFMTDHPVTLSRNLLIHARWLRRCGMSRPKVIETITRVNASILGIDDRLGVLARGKWASLTGWRGDPFELDAYPEAVVGEGELLYEAD